MSIISWQFVWIQTVDGVLLFEPPMTYPGNIHEIALELMPWWVNLFLLTSPEKLLLIPLAFLFLMTWPEKYLTTWKVNVRIYRIIIDLAGKIKYLITWPG